MKIALIASNRKRAQIFPPHLLEILARHGELAINEGGNTPEDILPVMKDADIVITSWGSPHLTKEYLDELDTGAHTLTIIYTDGSAKTTFTVAAEDKSEPPTIVMQPESQTANSGDKITFPDGAKELVNYIVLDVNRLTGKVSYHAFEREEVSDAE